MKDSNVDWLGQIPAHWNLKRAKFVFKQSSSKGNTNLVLLSATQDRGVVDKSTLEGVVQVAENADLNTFKTVHINDFVISLRSFQGGFEISHCEGVISPAYTVFRLREGDYVGYYKHLFKSVGFIDKINSLTVGIREGKNIQYEDFSNMLIPVLSIPEQQSIADFLDKKCGEIDEMVSLQEKIVEELKAYKQSVITEAVCKGLNPNVPMKNSGIGWIGQIPEGWEVRRGKNLAKVLSGFPFNSSLFSLDKQYIQLIRIRDILNNKSSTYYSGDYPLEAIVRKGDILVGMDGDFNVAFWEGEEGLLNQRVCKLIVNQGVVPKYMYYVIQSPLKEKNDITYSTTVKHLATDDIGVLFVPFPPYEEQQAIADYLDTKCGEIDTLISVRQTKIDALKEYKKSIIYEYITGKKELNG